MNQDKYRAVCDVCGAQGPLTDTEREAAWLARQKGWSVWDGDKALCPTCVIGSRKGVL